MPAGAAAVEQTLVVAWEGAALIARAPHMRYFLRHGVMPTDDEQIADLRWVHDEEDTRRLETLIGARLEPIRG